MNPHFTDVSTWPNDGKQWQTNIPYGNFCHADIAVVIGTYNRAHLLLRSLFHYQHCERPKYRKAIENETGQISYVIDDFHSIALVVMDDGSTDFTRELCEKFANERLPIYYFYLGDKEPGAWRDSAAFINKGLSFAIHALGSHFVFPTHPEICVGETTISDSVEWLKANRNGFALARGYYLTPEQQEIFSMTPIVWIDAIGELLSDFWEVKSISAFIEEDEERFYDYGDPTHPYHHCQVEKTAVWESWIFAGANRETWLEFGGFSESDAWGQIDLVFHAQRHANGFPTWTPQEKTAFVVHQNHSGVIDVPTPRDMDLAHIEAAKHGLSLEPKKNNLNLNRWITCA